MTLVVICLVATMARMIPGDPVDQILGDMATEDQRNVLRETLGLNVNVANQIVNYVTSVSMGDFGRSLSTGAPVASMVAERIFYTLQLALVSVFISVIISLPLGILAAANAGTWVDRGCMLVALVGVSVPNFWMGGLLVLVFSIYFDFLPVSGIEAGWTSFILPGLTIGTSLASVLTRMTRTAVLECLREDYVRTARAMGAANWAILYKHVLRNASLPISTIIGLQLGVVLTGSVVTETVFDWPGLGSLILTAIQSRDYPVIQGCVLLFSIVFLLVNLFTDFMYGVLDPRVRVE